MPRHHKLSFWAALFININIMFGTGIFINTVNLSKLVGFLGFVSYLLVALLILPLIFSVAALLKRHPSGGFYTYAGKDIHSFAGFLSAWSYFFGKLGSAALLVHVFTTLLLDIFPVIPIKPLVLDILILLTFTWLNTHNMKTGSQIMYTFFVLKVTPILFAILAGFYLINNWSVPAGTIMWQNIPYSIPLVLFAFVGFEASTSISRSIQNAKKNAPKVVLYSYSFVVLITILYQLMFFLSENINLMLQVNYLGAFPSLLTSLFPFNLILADRLVTILHLALATSALGGSYAMLFSTHWNLYALAQHKHTFFHDFLTKFNKHHIPVGCILAEVFICIAYLLLTGGRQIPLQQLGVLGMTIAYTFSVSALLITEYKGEKTYINAWVPRLALISCFVFLAACIHNFMIFGINTLFAFVLIIIFGSIMYWLTPGKNIQLIQKKA